MELVRNLNDLQSRFKECVATIGNFDGFHLGHQAVLQQLRRRADALSLPVTVVVFEPQPMEFFDPDNAPARLTRWREKYQLLREHGVDRMICIRFDAELASVSANDFVVDLLLGKVGVKHLLIGDDFRFGQRRKGNYALLCELGAQYDFTVEQSATFLLENARVSSSRIRALIASGDLDAAARLLGRNYSISGRVTHGKKEGRVLGFPTANIELQRMKTALQGIFVAKVVIEGLPDQPSVAYIGSKPTLGGTRSLLEAHLLDFSGNLYGRSIKVEFLQKLRDDKKFDSFESLKEQITIDANKAKEYFLEP